MKKARKKLFALILVVLTLTAGLEAFAAGGLTRSGALAAALKDAGLTKAQVTAVEVERDGRSYEVEFREKATGDQYEYEYRISDGRLKEKSVEYRHARNTSTERVSRAAALKAAAKAAGVKLWIIRAGSCRYKQDGREWIWEVKFKTRTWNYEIEILAPTGRVIEMSKERIK